MKHINKIITVLLLFGLLLIQFGCEKQKIPNNQIDSLLKSGNIYKWENVENTIIANSNNPLDSIGYYHNMMIDIIESLCDSTTTTERMFEVADSVLISNSCGYIDDDFSSEETSDMYMPICEVDSFYYFLDTLSLSQLQKNLIADLFDETLSYDGTNFAEVINAIKLLEDNVLSDYDKDDIQVFLMASSIGRYSLAYWHNRLITSKSMTLKSITVNWKKWVVGTCDVLGGVGGGAAAGIVTLGNPITIAYGAMTGAITTSLGASKLWDVFAK